MAALPLLVLRVYAADLPVPCAGDCAGPDVFVTSGSASYVVDGTTGTVVQDTDRVILNWREFNVAEGHRVEFKQPRDISVALNRIFQQDPSRILGALSANGQVYLINPNGVIFGAGSKTNTNTLLASSLAISDEVFFGNGLASSLEIDRIAALEASSDSLGNIDIEQGAVITTKEGGQVMLFAPKIVNEGSIRTPGGQTILGASQDRVYLSFSDVPSLRGFLVEVDTGGEIDNLGEIVAERGNITLAGLLLRQQGLLSATTSIEENGSIRLLARDQVRIETQDGLGRAETTRGGTLEILANSRTEVRLDPKAGAAVDSVEKNSSSIELMGRQVRIESNASLVARSGQVSIAATDNPSTLLAEGKPRNDSRVHLESGAIIDVSGTTDVVLPMSRNQVDVELRSNELADAPVQKGGVAQGVEVSVDARRGTQFAEVQGAIDNIERSLSERSLEGGTVSIASDGDVVIDDGATIDVSGGYVRYESGAITSSQVLAGGRLVGIEEANPDEAIQAVYAGVTKRHESWGVSETFADPTGTSAIRYEEGYVEGSDAGALEITAHDVVLDGTVRADVVVGRHQRVGAAEAATAYPYQRVPRGGEFALDLSPSNTPFGNASIVDLRIGAVPGSEDVLIDPAWLGESAFGSIEIETLGTIVVDDGLALDLRPGTRLSLLGGPMTFGARVRAPGGDIRLGTLAFDTNSELRITSDALFDLSGQFVNDYAARGDLWPSAWIDGGSIEVAAEGDLIMEPGSRIYANGGAWVSGEGEVIAGSGGDISLASSGLGDTRFIPSANLTAFAMFDGGSLYLEGNALALYESALPVGGVIGEVIDPETVLPVLAPYPDLPFIPKVDAFIPSWLLDSSGFADVHLASNRYGLVVQTGSRIAPSMLNYVLPASSFGYASGTTLDGVFRLTSRPTWDRAPVSLTLEHLDLGLLPYATGVIARAGTEIVAEPGAAITIASESSLWLQGTVSAPAGLVDVRINAPEDSSSFDPTQVVYIDAGAVLRANGAVVLEPDPLGLRRGNVLPGGEVRITAERGFVVAQPGSLIEVSGASAELDITRSDPNTFERVEIESDAGSVRIQTAEGAVLAGAISGGAVAGRGANVDIVVDTNFRNAPLGGGGFSAVDNVLAVVAEPPAIDFGFGDAVDPAVRNRTAVSLSTLSGVDGLALRAREQIPIPLVLAGSTGVIRFESDLDARLDRQLTLDAMSISGGPGVEVSLSAPTMTVGNSVYLVQSLPASVRGDAALSLSADTLNVLGAFGMSGFDDVRLEAARDLRLAGVLASPSSRTLFGSLTTAADLTLVANRVYGTPLSEFRIRVPEGTLAVGSHVEDMSELPLFTYGAQLDFEARDVVIDGRILSPGGVIDVSATGSVNLADGALVSTRTLDEITLFGRTQAGLDWVYPLANGRLELFDSLTPSRIDIAGTEVLLDAGATVDAAGGGDLLAVEFIPGPGGSRDYLAEINRTGGFVILPLNDPFVAPSDTLESLGFPYAPDTTITLDGVAGLPNGEFAVLPAGYAHLPGSYLVVPVAGTTDIVSGELRYDTDGAPVVAGRFGFRGGSVLDARTQGFRVVPGSFADLNSEYAKRLASDWFEPRDSWTPLDGGNIAVTSSVSFALDGSVVAAGRDGYGDGRLTLSSGQLAVTAGGVPPPSGSWVTVNDADLDRFAVGALELQGDRLLIGSGATLEKTEIALAADDALTVESGAVLRALAGGELAFDREEVDGNAALLVSSIDYESPFSTVSGATGDLLLDAGASIFAPGALFARAGGIAALDAQLDARGSFELQSSRIALGEVPEEEAEGYAVLDSETLSALLAPEIRLSASDRVAIFGELTLSLTGFELDTPRLVGYEADALVESTRLTLTNSRAAAGTIADIVGSAGRIDFSAADILTNGAGLRAAGVQDIVLRSSGALRVAQSGGILTTDALSLFTPAMAVASGADGRFGAGGVLGLQSLGAASGELPLELGGSVRLEGSSVLVDSLISARAGVVTARSTVEDVVLGANARVDARGAAVEFDEAVVTAPAGTVHVDAARNIVVDADSVIDVSPDPEDGGSGGSVSLDARQGQLLGAGEMRAGRDGNASIDVGSVSDLAAVNAQLAAGGFGGERYLRVRDGDVQIDGDISASSLQLIADTGSVRIDGSVHAVESARIAAATGVTVDGTLASDGLVEVRAADAAGLVRVSSGGRLTGPAVDVILKSNETTTERVLVDGELQSDQARLLFEVDVDVTDAVFDTADQSALRALIEGEYARLSGTGLSGFSLSPLASVSSAGNLTVTGTWDLSNWRFGDAAGTLSVRAGGDLIVSGRISDGFRVEDVDFGDFVLPVDRLQEDASWSYGLVAGADLSSAALDAVQSAPRTLRFGNDALVRTGSGDIGARSSGDVVFAPRFGGLYTAGISTGSGGFPDDFWALALSNAEFPVRGGDVTVAARRDIIGSGRRPLPSEVMMRLGVEYGGQPVPTLSGVAFSSVLGEGTPTNRYDVASFGGGAVRLSSGGNLSGLALAAPQTLKPTDFEYIPGSEFGDFTIEFDERNVMASASEGVRIDAGGDIVGGIYYVGTGFATITASGDMRNASDGLAPVLLTNNADVRLLARQDLTIESMVNATMLPIDEDLQLSDTQNLFFTYDPASSLTLTSVSGVAKLKNNRTALGAALGIPPFAGINRPLDIYPSTLSVHALRGDIAIDRGMTLFPGAGGLELLAYRDVLNSSSFTSSLVLSDADPALLANVAAPDPDITDTLQRMPISGGRTEFIHAAVPVHSQDTTPSVVQALTGSILTPLLDIDSSEPLRMLAAQDISVARIVAQHTRSDDVSVVSSGGDLKLIARRDPDTGQLRSNNRIIQVAGPGSLEVLAGRSIDLGTSIGIQTIGNTENPALAEQGASVSVFSGFAGAPAVDAFISQYVAESDDYDDLLSEFAEDVWGESDLSKDEILERVGQSSSVERRLAVAVLFEELKASGIAASALIAESAPKEDVELAYERGRSAIATLFPEDNDFSGDLSLFFSRISTLAGGDINLLVPGGFVNVGLTDNSLSSKTISELGIVAQGPGDVNIFADGDIAVNRSRVFTLNGGDISVWSSTGDIDAGRGAKTALDVPPLQARLGPNDSIEKIVPPAVSGSGIAAASGTSDDVPSIVLATPEGIVDAGDAGIRTPGKLFTAANDVIGRDNIDVGGFVGAPADTVVLSADVAGVGDTAASAAEAAATAVNQGGQQAAEESQTEAALGWLDVFLEGFGEGGQTCDPDDPDCKKRG